MTYAQIRALLKEKGQEQLLAFYDELDAAGQARLLERIEKTDWSFEEVLAHPEDLSGKGRELRPIDGLRLPEIARRKAEFEEAGIGAIRQGKVAAVLLAGGQGTRLGADGPKGAYNIGLTRELSVFACQMRSLLETAERCGVFVPLYIMTSEKNDAQTRAFWKEHGYFGYPESEVRFFVQDMAPAVDFDGKIYLEEKDAPAFSPNGNGGWFASLAKAGYAKELRRRGVEWVNVYAVDNVLQKIADPVFVGATLLSGVNCGAKVVCKTSPEEKVGVLCLEDGKPAIIEYYELSPEMAGRREPDGSLSFVYGVILNYLFRVEKLKEISGRRIPVHIVKKKIEHIDNAGNHVKPERENGFKFETLAVDLIRPMESVLPFEVDREKEFAPVKNRTGTDSVDSARALLEKNGIRL